MTKNPFLGKQVLVTGGLGFIGSNLAITLVRLGAKVTIVDALIKNHGGNLFNIVSIKKKVSLILANLRERGKIRSLLKGKEYIFNLAGSVSHLDSLEKPFVDLESNVEAHLSLLEELRRINPKARVLYASTRQVYGNPVYLPVDEKHPVSPVDLNGVNKSTAEQFHLLYHRVYGLPVVILRLTNTYGPRQLIEHPRQGFIGWFIHQAIRGETIDLFDGGKQVRDVNFVDDVVRAFCLSASQNQATGEIFNLGGVRYFSLFEIAKRLTTLTGRGNIRSAPMPVKLKPIGIRDIYMDFSKIRQALGWAPKVSLHAGLSQTVRFYKRYGKHYLR